MVFGCFDLRFDAGLSGGLGWLLVFSGCLRFAWVVLRWLFCLFLGFLGTFFSCGGWYNIELFGWLCLLRCGYCVGMVWFPLV